MKEQELVKIVISEIFAKGGWAMRVNSGTVFKGSRAIRAAPTGTSDIIGLIDGRFIAIECKIGDNKPTPSQHSFLELVYSLGGDSIWMNDSEEDWRLFEDFISISPRPTH